MLKKKGPVKELDLSKNFNSAIALLELAKEKPVCFIDTSTMISGLNLKDREVNRYKNYYEAAIATLLLDHFKTVGVSTDSMRVCSPFK